MSGPTAIRDDELGGDYDRFCDGELGEPHRFAAALRELDPVHWSERLNAWVLTRYDDVLNGLSDPRFGNDRIAAYMAALSPENRREPNPDGAASRPRGCRDRGRLISAGETVLMMIGAANRDGAQFREPDRLDVG
jgi:cytochrome P450